MRWETWNLIIWIDGLEVLTRKLPLHPRNIGKPEGYRRFGKVSILEYNRYRSFMQIERDFPGQGLKAFQLQIERAC